MKKNTSPKKSHKKLNRSETVTVRLDPMLRYVCELASRVERRTISSFIEGAVEEIVKQKQMYLDKDGRPVTFEDAGYQLWHHNEPDRVCALASKFPKLLTRQEQSLWKLIQEVKILRKENNHKEEWALYYQGLPIIRAIREAWPFLVQHLNDELSYDELEELITQNVKPLSYWKDADRIGDEDEPEDIWDV